MSNLFINEFEEEIDQLREPRKTKDVEFPSNSIIIERGSKFNERVDAFYNALKQYSIWFDSLQDNLKEPVDIAIILGIMRYHFQNKSLITKKNSETYKINILGKE